MIGKINPYKVLRSLLFLLDPEDTHDLTMKLLALGLGPRFDKPDDPILANSVFKLHFPNPIGLAAGLDKQATCIDPLMRLGFGSIEIGCVTPRPQFGNPRPRLFRVPEARGLINRFGFNSAGLDAFAGHLEKWHRQGNRTRNPVGVNIGKNKDSLDAAEDYVACLTRVAPYADFVTLNVSSPNTPGLRALQDREALTRLIDRVSLARNSHAPELPILIKIAPDITDEQKEDIAAAVVNSGVQGMIISNTTLSRPENLTSKFAYEAGGYSGPYLFEMSTKLLGDFYKLTKGKIPLVGVGGIFTGEDAYKKIRCGASLVQIYTALIYEGPSVVRRIKNELIHLLRRDGFKSISAAVGVDVR